MRHIPAGAATERATPVDARSLLDDREPSTPAQLWARLKAHERALPDILEEALRRLLAEELALRPEHVRATALELLERSASHHGPFTLRIHPDDRPLLDALGQDVAVEADATIQRGGCVLVCAALELDASVETRLSRVLEALHG